MKAKQKDKRQVELSWMEIIDILESMMVALRAEGCKPGSIGTWLGLLLAQILKKEEIEGETSNKI